MGVLFKWDIMTNEIWRSIYFAEDYEVSIKGNIKHNGIEVRQIRKINAKSKVVVINSMEYSVAKLVSSEFLDAKEVKRFIWTPKDGNYDNASADNITNYIKKDYKSKIPIRKRILIMDLFWMEDDNLSGTIAKILELDKRKVSTYINSKLEKHFKENERRRQTSD